MDYLDVIIGFAVLSVIFSVLACRLCGMNHDKDEHEDLNEPK